MVAKLEICIFVFYSEIELTKKQMPYSFYFTQDSNFNRFHSVKDACFKVFHLLGITDYQESPFPFLTTKPEDKNLTQNVIAKYDTIKFSLFENQAEANLDKFFIDDLLSTFIKALILETGENSFGKLDFYKGFGYSYVYFKSGNEYLNSGITRNFMVKDKLNKDIVKKEVDKIKYELSNISNTTSYNRKSFWQPKSSRITNELQEKILEKLFLLYPVNWRIDLNFKTNCYIAYIDCNSEVEKIVFVNAISVYSGYKYHDLINHFRLNENSHQFTRFVVIDDLLSFFKTLENLNQSTSKRSLG